MRRVGEVLQAQFAQVHEEAKTLVENAYYKNVSVSLNQSGGLAHIGLLGAVQPAIPGLREVQFAEGEESVVLEFAARTSQDAEIAFAQSKLAHYEEQERIRTRQGIESRIDSLCSNGQIMPPERDRILEFALAVADGGGNIQFSSGEPEMPMAEAFLDILDNSREPSMLFASYTGGREGSPVTLKWAGTGRPPKAVEEFNTQQTGAAPQETKSKNPAYLI